MTAKELAEMLDRRERGKEINLFEMFDAEEDGLVVVFGCSDDNVEFRGAMDDEIGACEGATIYLTKTGVLKKCEKAKTVKAVWHDEGGPCWTFETDIPHETFTILEDGNPWCIGIVFSMEDLERQEENGGTASQ